jgi:hypothetical protein
MNSGQTALLATLLLLVYIGDVTGETISTSDLVCVAAEFVRPQKAPTPDHISTAQYHVYEQLSGREITTNVFIQYYPVTLKGDLPKRAVLVLVPSNNSNLFAAAGAQIGLGIWLDTPSNRQLVAETPASTFAGTSPEKRISELHAFEIAYHYLGDTNLFQRQVEMRSERHPFSWFFDIKWLTPESKGKYIQGRGLEISDEGLVISVHRPFVLM